MKKYDDYTHMTDEVKSVEKPRKSKWEICSDGYYPYCPKCMKEPPSGIMTKYCPNCGELMG